MKAAALCAAETAGPWLTGWRPSSRTAGRERIGAVVIRSLPIYLKNQKIYFVIIAYHI